MCGIVGYVGQKQALEIVVEGLRRLEYRGYDSAGRRRDQRRPLEVRKKAGKLANLETLLGSDPCPTPRPESATPAGPRTAVPPTATPIRT